MDTKNHNIFRLIEKIFREPNYINWKIKTQFSSEINPKIYKITNKIVFSKLINNLVVMFHIGRSGSTLVGDMLGQHPQIVWEGEIYKNVLNIKKIHSNLPKTNKTKFSSIKHYWYGFEVKFFHLTHFNMSLKDYLKELENIDIDKFIILQRKNYLRKIISSLIASQNACWHKPQGLNVQLTPININPEFVSIDGKTMPLYDLLNEYDNNFHLLKKLIPMEKALWLTYEDDIEGSPSTAYSRVINFLDLENYNVKIRYGKLNPFNLSQLISNYEDVASYLSSTKFEWMVER